MSLKSTQAHLPTDDVDISSLQHPSIAEAISQAGELAANNAASFEDVAAEHYCNKQLMRSSTGIDLQAAALLLEDCPDNAYTLNSQKLSRYRRGVERRLMKDRLYDRRSKLRLDSDGNVQRDRRAINRLANLASVRTMIKH